MDPEDPAAPADGEIADGLTLAEAIQLANGHAEAEPHEHAPAPASPMPIDIRRVLAFLNACVTSRPRVTYGLGAKVPTDASQPGAPVPPGFIKVDCSGFVRAAIRRSTSPEAVDFPDGSVVQHEWTAAHGFPRGAVDDGDRQDGLVRIAFLPPRESPEGVGHVVLIHNGRTIESHGGTGPDRRQWNALKWRTKTEVFALTW